MKDLLKVVFILMMVVGVAEACDDKIDYCTQMEEPCEPIDLCASPCDPIAD
jgi:hypothetical protein